MYTGYYNKILANTADTLSLISSFYESRSHIWPTSAVFPVPNTVLAHSKWTVRTCPINEWWTKMWYCIDINQCNKSFVNLRSGRVIEGVIENKIWKRYLRISNSFIPVWEKEVSIHGRVSGCGGSLLILTKFLFVPYVLCPTSKAVLPIPPSSREAALT